MTLPTGLTKAIASFATPIAMNLVERNQMVINLRNHYNLKHENLPDNFPIVYAYTLVEYGTGKEEPLLNLFEQPEVEEAFRCEFRENNPEYLEEAIKESVTWEYLDWNTLGEQVKYLAKQAKLETTEYLRQEIEEFRKVFYQNVLPLTLKPSQIHQDRKIEEILNNVKKLDTLDEIRTAVQEIIRLIKDGPTFNTDELATDSVTLNTKLQTNLTLYLSQCYRDEKVAKLDQAGERDSEKETYLNSIFIDLDVRLREEIKTQKGIYRKFRQKINKIRQINEEITEQISEDVFFENDGKPLSLMECLLKEVHERIVIIGGPGQGKSTSGQHLAQIHRAKLLKEDYDDKYQPETVRIPFQVVLKDFAQWLANEPEIEALDSYLAERVSKLAKCPGDVTPQDIQEIFSKRNCLLLLDGLDEVVEPKLKKQMLNKIKDFLEDRQSSTENNILVVATSRPNSYDNQFDPEQFIHLELEFLNTKKVKEYAQKWVTAKKLTDDETSNTLNTLKDCQKDQHIQGLLTTPLQVTIILIIIKSGRRPPSQREDLFNEYWLTIFRREESKDRGKAIIKSKESFLLNLHSVLGYSIHRRAIQKNVKSLLPEEEFKDLVTDFLNRKEGNCSTEDEIKQKMNRLVKEVGERLVLIVQKEAGYYGFDLRSFQEFFAAIYLVQAKDTKQRFERLTAIAPYQHWRNVALFAAGRIARNFSGEVTQLSTIWRSIDRGEVNRYLKPGAWLALQIAADGSLSDEANLQYDAVSDGLKVLETGLTSQQNDQLKSLLSRLTEREKNKILRPILEEKLSLLPEACLIPGLYIYGEFFGGNDFFRDKLDLILQGQKEALINEALNLAVKYKMTPNWVADKFNNHWHYFEKNFEYILTSNFQSFEYIQKILAALENLQGNRLFEVIKNTIEIEEYYGAFEPIQIYSGFLIKIIKQNTSYSISDQVIIFVLLKLLTQKLSNRKKTDLEVDIDNETDFMVRIYEDDVMFLSDLSSIKNDLQNSLEQLLRYPDLVDANKLFSWYLLIFIEPRNKEYISSFLENLVFIKTNQSIDCNIFRNRLRDNYPLLSLVSELLIKENKDVITDVVDFVDYDKQGEVALYIKNTIVNYLNSSTEEEKRNFLFSLRYSINLDKFFPELNSIIDTTRISLQKIIEQYVSILVHVSDRSHQNFVLDKDILSKIMISDQDNVSDSEKLIPLLIILASSNIHWSLETDDIEKVIQFFEIAIENIDTIYKENIQADGSIFPLMLTLLLKLLDYGYPQENLFKLIHNTPLFTLKISNIELILYIRRVLSEKRINILHSLLEDKDREILLKGTIIWKAILDGRDEHPSILRNSLKLLEDISFNVDIGKSLFQEKDSKFHTIGITFLTYSDYPIEDYQEKQQLLHWLKNTNSDSLEKEWFKFIKKIVINDDKGSHWSSFLEEILKTPKQFGHWILSAAMERYQSLNNNSEITVSEQKEQELDLL